MSTIAAMQAVLSVHPAQLWFTELLARYPRVAVAGGPRTGKSLGLAAFVTDRPVIHTDDWMASPWEDVPALAIAEVDGMPSFVIEGVQVPRALRKGLVVDVVVWLEVPLVYRTVGQESMAAGVATVFRDWLASSGAAGVPIIRGEMIRG